MEISRHDFFCGGIYYLFMRSVIILENEIIKPMDKTFTSEFEITGSVIAQALKNEKFPKPSVSSIEFIKNFARNFRVQKNIEGDIREFVLN